MAEKENQEGIDAPVASQGKNPMIVGALVGIVVVAAAAGGWLMRGSGGGGHPPDAFAQGKNQAHDNGGAKQAHNKNDPPIPMDSGNDVGPVVNLDTFIVNILSELNETHYLKTTFAVEVVSEPWIDVVKKKMGRVRHEVILYLAGLTMDEVYGAENKAKISKEVQERIARVVNKEAVRKVYISEFVIQ